MAIPLVLHRAPCEAARPESPALRLELTELAQRMVTASDPIEADRLQEELVKGFY